MSYGFSDQKATRRRRWRNIRWAFSTGIFVALAVTSYWSGEKIARLEVSGLEQKVDELSKGVAELREKNAALEERAAAADRNETEWREKYAADVPTGKSKDLLALIETQIEKGADPERVAFLVDTAADERVCDPATLTKRFLVRTPLFAGANDAVTFAQNAITVTGQGESAVSAGGIPEQWYDPAKPVTLQFAEPGGGGSKASGPLPLHHSVVRGTSEYRFSIVDSGKQGFINITAERCAFP